MQKDVREFLEEAVVLLENVGADAADARDSHEVAALIELGARRLNDRKILELIQSALDDIYDLPESMVDAYLEDKDGQNERAVADKLLIADKLIQHILDNDHIDWKKASSDD